MVLVSIMLWRSTSRRRELKRASILCCWVSWRTWSVRLHHRNHATIGYQWWNYCITFMWTICLMNNIYVHKYKNRYSHWSTRGSTSRPLREHHPKLKKKYQIQKYILINHQSQCENIYINLNNVEVSLRHRLCDLVSSRKIVPSGVRHGGSKVGQHLPRTQV